MAGQTAYLTARLVELIVESGILPEGTVQMVCGDPRDLLDHLTEQDIVGFTGSASTARLLRTHPVIVGNAVRFNAEADSLNCSILGPDAAPGTKEFDLYVKQLVQEMTVKAGQKCTAIRRALVPAALIDDVTEAVRDRLSKITVGNPADPDVRMGALATLDQREEVRRSLKALMDVNRVVFGDPEHVDVVGADAERGAFISPVLLRADDTGRAEPHEVEAFGPVSTLLPVRGRRGGGRAGRARTRQPRLLGGDRRPGLRPRHRPRHRALARAPARAELRGRQGVHRARVAAAAARPRRPRPRGRRRGDGRHPRVVHHMRRTAVQSGPAMLTSITGRWVPGTDRTVTDEHPFRKYLEDLCVGDTAVGGPRTVTLDDVEHFAEFTGDTFYAHMDEEAAKANPFFPGRVAHGYLVVSFAAGLFVEPSPAPSWPTTDWSGCGS